MIIPEKKSIYFGFGANPNLQYCQLGELFVYHLSKFCTESVRQHLNSKLTNAFTGVFFGTEPLFGT